MKSRYVLGFLRLARIIVARAGMGHTNVDLTHLNKGANPNDRYEGGFTPLMEMSRSPKSLLAHIADRAIRVNGKGAVDFALEKGHKETA